MESEVSNNAMTIFGAPVAELSAAGRFAPKPSNAWASKNPGSLVLRTGAVSVGDGWPLTGFL